MIICNYYRSTIVPFCQTILNKSFYSTSPRYNANIVCKNNSKIIIIFYFNPINTLNYKHISSVPASASLYIFLLFILAFYYHMLEACPSRSENLVLSNMAQLKSSRADKDGSKSPLVKPRWEWQLSFFFTSKI